MHRHFNGLKTAALLGLLTALILGIGFAVAGTSGLVIALIISLLLNGTSYFWSDKIALRSMRARPVSEAEFPALYQMVRELAADARQPMPRLYVSPTMQPNAFATGRNPQHAAVCVTTGITQILDYRELRAVIGHELSHVYNRDILISSVAAAIGGMITFLAYLAWFLPVGGDDDEGQNPAVFFAMLILGPFAASIIQLAISRNREYQADASGAALSRDPLALASALRKIDAGARQLPLPADNQYTTTAHLMIANPLRGAGLAKLFSTHPPMADRVRRLEEMANRQVGPVQFQ
ncbi:zinc metalloprotease HtpX [Asanoa sp. NPDC049518]|uniref:zinc metalloprotease HtpX n=1 Tax=unclassified Asanoa TaxID=2685164 RepID=UPI00341C81DB